MKGSQVKLKPKESRFINNDIYFMTHGTSVGFSQERYSTYDEARKVVDEDCIACERNGIESELFMAANVGDDHFKALAELIRHHHHSMRKVESPMVVLFHRRMEHQILPEATLTTSLWLKDPMPSMDRWNSLKSNYWG